MLFKILLDRSVVSLANYISRKHSSLLLIIFPQIVNLFILNVHVQLCQTQSPRTKFPSHTRAGMPQPFTCFPTSEIAASPRPLELLAAHDSCNSIGASFPNVTDISLLPLASLPPERGVDTNNLVCSSSVVQIFIFLNVVCCYLMFDSVFLFYHSLQHPSLWA